MLLTMENKNIEFSVDHREYQMISFYNLPKNTPKGAKKLICEIQKERDFLLEQNEQLQSAKVTMEYQYDMEKQCHNDDIDKNEQNEKLKENYKAVLKTLYNTEYTDHDLLDDCGDICEDIGNLKEEKYENNEFRQELGRIMDKHYLCREGEIDVVFENTLDENERLKQNQLTEENAMEYIYENSGQYETWIEGSDLYKKLKEDNEKLKQKARSWDIVNKGSDWENLRDLCDKSMCEDLIECGECDKEDFEGYFEAMENN